MMQLWLLDTEWNGVTHEFFDEGVESKKMIVRDGTDIIVSDYGELEEWNKIVTRVVFLLNVMKVGESACYYAINLVVVEIPEGVQSIGDYAFCCCLSLTTVSFPATLTSIGVSAFCECSSLDNVDLLHTNLQELGEEAFQHCSELKLMTIPDSLQTLGDEIFYKCSKLVPSSIDVREYDDDGALIPDTTSEVVAYLRSQQLLSATPPAQRATKFMTTDYFRNLLVQFMMDEILMTMRLVSKPWLTVVDEFIDDEVESGEMIVHGRNDDSEDVDNEVLKERRTVKRVVFLLNITKVGILPANTPANLLLSISPRALRASAHQAFHECINLTSVSLPTTLTSIGRESFRYCKRLERVDFRQKNLQEIGNGAFRNCYKLKSMTFPESLQNFGNQVFYNCGELIPSNMATTGYNTPTIVAYLRTLMQMAEKAELKSQIASLKSQVEQ
ncbi:hypothetical protein TL16_g08959 [Triparma laevis f. inornata]|uniref:Uncharacterized protein n=1 Tax=Triparma laevis f. inornata TaxID=1714386 RepID=A0A9W7EHS6_9STRA|nr:hypothetical protein TL16_g08959 [Triparma laevis f. inornata]